MKNLGLASGPTFCTQVGATGPIGSILSNAVNPGAIATGLQKHTGGLKTPVERRKTPEQGAAISELLAASPLLEDVGGVYFEDCKPIPAHHETSNGFQRRCSGLCA